MTPQRDQHHLRSRLRLLSLEQRVTPALFAVGSGASTTFDTTVRVFDDMGVFKTEFKPYTNGTPGNFFRGGAEVATGDFNNDGVEDVFVGAGPGGGPHLKVYNGVDLIANSPNPGLLFETFVFNNFTGGLHVSAGDVDGDGFDDAIVGAGPGGSPHVKVFSGAGSHPLLMSYYAFDAAFGGGVTVAGGDIGGDITTDEIIVGTGAGIASSIRVYNFVPNANNQLTDQKIADFPVFNPTFTGGIFVASGKTSNNRDTSNFLYADIIASAGLGGGPHVKVFRLLDALYNPTTGAPENWRFFDAASYYAYNPNFLGGVRVGAVNHGNGGLDDIITSAGVNGGPHVRLYNQTSIGDLVTYSPTQRFDFYAFDPSFIGGTFVG